MKNRLRSVLPVLSAFALLAGVPAHAARKGERPAAGTITPKVNAKSWDLSNGLKVLFVEDHKAPLVTVWVFYHVGSKDEKVGIRGIAHMFEHMMWKGTNRVAPEEHARLVKAVGGVSNAFTTEDITAYHQTVPPSYVGFALELEAERMRNLKLLPGTVDSERKVVMEEKRLRIDNNPVARALETLRATAFETHPYGWTPAGDMADLEHITVEDCQKFYDAYYRPNNATVVVVGDAAEADVRKLVAKYFSSVPRGSVPTRAAEKQEKPQGKAREKALALRVQLPVIIGGYHIPAARHADIPALQVLATILSEGESSRIPMRLVRKEKLAVAAGGVAEALEHPGLFMVYALYLPDRDVGRVRDVLMEEIARVREAGVTARELEKAKNQLAAQYIFGLESADGVAAQLGNAAYVEGDWRNFLKGASRYLAVTADDVKRVAQQYLGDAALTLVSIMPPGAGQEAVKP